MAELKTKATGASVADGKSCLYFRRLADLDPGILEQLAASSVEELRAKYGESNFR